MGHNIQKHTAGPGQQGPFFSRGQLLVQQASDKPADESNQDIHQISFPRYEDIKAECPDAKYQYLFTLDDTAFFRVALSHADKMHILEVTGGKFINRHYMRSASPKSTCLPR